MFLNPISLYFLKIVVSTLFSDRLESGFKGIF
ncbi:hypothetical protein LSS_00035 [Leptospira santarosai serovar Shermani str. LT 821]|uniref:Uncharacterized protein n=1 Tax=Leptospira santarosai serovar Shermani str. LT 821 TaxID=758847 RepID=K8Y500_9LEPT|nr:hypothetical protein LSS_00035 [Leptospira santarosai serovar Shermani str. LT 821]